MADNPKNNEDRYNRILTAWRTLASDKTFGGMTLAQFEEQCGKSNEAREKIDNLEDRMKQALADRAAEDVATLRACESVVKSVVADPAYGDDSALYETMGYVRKSDRKSGLTRKKTETEKG